MGNRFGRWGISPVNTVIIAANVVVFIFMVLTGDPQSTVYMYEHGANFWPDVFEGHEYYRLITCAFIHFDITHIFNNMLVLAFIGDNLERALGSVKYLILYFVSAIGASLISDAAAMMRESYNISGGASGAVFGVVGALFVIVILNHGRLDDISSRQLGLFAILSVYHGVTSAGIDNAAHVGGLAVGAVLALLLYRRKRSNDTYFRR